jgi:hypothetical protein
VAVGSGAGASTASPRPKDRARAAGAARASPDVASVERSARPWKAERAAVAPLVPPLRRATWPKAERLSPPGAAPAAEPPAARDTDPAERERPNAGRATDAVDPGKEPGACEARYATDRVDAAPPKGADARDNARAPGPWVEAPPDRARFRGGGPARAAARAARCVRADGLAAAGPRAATPAAERARGPVEASARAADRASDSPVQAPAGASAVGAPRNAAEGARGSARSGADQARLAERVAAAARAAPKPRPPDRSPPARRRGAAAGSAWRCTEEAEVRAPALAVPALRGPALRARVGRALLPDQGEAMASPRLAARARAGDALRPAGACGASAVARAQDTLRESWTPPEWDRAGAAYEEPAAKAPVGTDERERPGPAAAEAATASRARAEPRGIDAKGIDGPIGMPAERRAVSGLDGIGRPDAAARPERAERDTLGRDGRADSHVGMTRAPTQGARTAGASTGASSTAWAYQGGVARTYSPSKAPAHGSNPKPERAALPPSRRDSESARPSPGRDSARLDLRNACAAWRAVARFRIEWEPECRSARSTARDPAPTREARDRRRPSKEDVSSEAITAPVRPPKAEDSASCSASGGPSWTGSRSTQSTPTAAGAGNEDPQSRR